MKLLYELIAPLWAIDTTTLECRLEFIGNLLSASSQVYEWGGKRYIKDRKKMQQFVDMVKLELLHRHDKTYRQLVSAMIDGKEGEINVLLMADRLTELADTQADLDKADQYRKWIDKKNNTKVYT